MLPVIAFPVIDPVALAIGPFQIRWYALAYIGGIVLGWRLLLRLVAREPVAADRRQVDDFVTWATLGIILGGRLGYVLFYRPGFYITVPWEALYVWQGGMSFHGGALGVIVATLWFCRREGIDALRFGDRLAVCVPIGLGLGRLANFINGELWGQVSDVPWAMVFPGAGPLPRHPSQLYQAALEGLVLFLLLLLRARNPDVLARRGYLTGLFLAGYGAARIVGETFREPDAHLGFLAGGLTMGQILSLPMVVAGLWLMRRKPA